MKNKTASEYLLETETYIVDDNKRIYFWGDDAVKAMQEYAKQVAEEVRQDILKNMPEPIATAYAYKYKYKTEKYIQQINLDEFIK